MRVVDGPEAVEEEVGLVPLGGVLHVEVRLVAHHVVHKVEPVGGEGGREEVLVVRSLVARKEETLVASAFNKGVGGVAVGLGTGVSQ